MKPFRSSEKLRDSFGPHFGRMEQAEVAKTLKDFIFLERELESARIELALKPDFNLLDAFRMIDFQGKGFILRLELLDALRSVLRMPEITNEDCLLLFKRYDQNNDGKLSFKEFCNAVTPLSKEYAQLLSSRPDFFSTRARNPEEFFNGETREELRRLWRKLIQTEQASEDIRENIIRRSSFSLLEAFQFIDKAGRGRVGAEELKEVLAQQGFYATDRELLSLMEKLDRDRDGEVTMGEFREELTPKLH